VSKSRIKNTWKSTAPYLLYLSIAADVKLHFMFVLSHAATRLNGGILFAIVHQLNIFI